MCASGLRFTGVLSVPADTPSRFELSPLDHRIVLTTVRLCVYCAVLLSSHSTVICTMTPVHPVSVLPDESISVITVDLTASSRLQIHMSAVVSFFKPPSALFPFARILLYLLSFRLQQLPERRDGVPDRQRNRHVPR